MDKIFFYFATFDKFYGFANLKNVFNNNQKLFADFAFIILELVQKYFQIKLTKPNPTISKKITKLLKVG